MIEGTPLGGADDLQAEALAMQLQDDAAALLAAVLPWAGNKRGDGTDERTAQLSVVLVDDERMRALNLEWRGKDAPTDVLSFAQEESGAGGDDVVRTEEDGAADDEEGEDDGDFGDWWPELPVRLLGDLVVSLDTAARQAEERGHGLRDECRVLLVHGLLHLFGYDHIAEPDAREMREAEARALAQMGWTGAGLIAEAGVGGDVHGEGEGAVAGAGRKVQAAAVSGSSFQRRDRPAVLALDMDGTLLNSSSKVSRENVEAIRAALGLGVRVVIATGKARAAAAAALAPHGLSQPGGVVSQRSPGVFLQGLQVHGHEGRQVSEARLPDEVVRSAFAWAQETGTSLVAFLGDACVTLDLTDLVLDLHTTYYEPLAAVAPSLDALCSSQWDGAPPPPPGSSAPVVRKLLFLDSPEKVDSVLKPHWAAALDGTGATTMQAVPTMLEVCPVGHHKGTGLELMMRDLGLPMSELMACGDGMNDLEMVTAAGLGVAMANAVEPVRVAADHVVASNDDHGVAEAIEKFLL
ncbi:unnamed protein product [Pedinophyceae sp. YPF-701]|nr:unnamed protein product [Pedinophyceae sp. YPF-701]